jgi:hypothetical protein
MTRTNWEKIAEQEFKSMDPSERASFADLYARVS